VIGGRWTGVDGAAEALVRVATEVSRDEVVADAMLRVSRPIAAEMEEALYRRIKRVSGETGASMAARQVDKADVPGIVTVAIGPLASSDAGWRVKFWEFGTSRLSARPFMRPTWDEHERTFSGEVVKALHGAYKRAVARYARRTA